MSTQICLHLPVADLPRSKQFYEALGFQLNPQFSGEQCAMLTVSETISLMLSARAFFNSFIPSRSLSDPRSQAAAIFCLSLDSRAAVDTLVDKALAAGVSSLHDPEDHGFMYERNFEDPDGHLWQVLHMDASAAPPAA